MLTVYLCNHAWFWNRDMDIPKYDWGRPPDTWRLLKTLERFRCVIFVSSINTPAWVLDTLLRFAKFNEKNVCSLSNGDVIKFLLLSGIERLK